MKFWSFNLFSFRCTLSIGVFLVSVVSLANVNQTYVVYGKDDRLESYEINNVHVAELSRATVALVAPWRLVRQDDDYYNIKAETAGGAYALCPTEKYFEQPSMAYCSGILVDEDLVLTAGHCMRWTPVTCWGVYFVFDYKLGRADEVPSEIRAQDVYRCSEVVEQNVSVEQDAAIIRLDRKVINRTPVLVSPEVSIKKGEALFAIGHPMGLPQKVAWGGSIREVHKNNFVASLDVFVNNSGSPVFRKKDGALLGIVKDGEGDFVYDEQNRCQATKHCAETDCLGEDIQRLSFFSKDKP